MAQRPKSIAMRMHVDAPCTFCSEMEDVGSSDFASICMHLEGRCVARSASFELVAGLGGFRAPYLLLLSRRHVVSFSMLTKAELTEAQLIVRAVEEYLRAMGVNVMCFEHGASSGANSGACIDHAHLHVSTFEDSLMTELRDELEPIASIASLTQLPAVVGGEPYLLWADEPDSLWVARTSGQKIPSQFFRRRLASQFQVEAWDWALDPACDVVATTLEIMSGFDVQSPL